MDSRRSTRNQEQGGNDPQVTQLQDPGVARGRQRTPQQTRGRSRPRAPSSPPDFHIMPQQNNPRRSNTVPLPMNAQQNAEDINAVPNANAAAIQAQPARDVPMNVQLLDPSTGRLVIPRNDPTPMRPLDVANEYALDYTSPQTIKFFKNGIEKLSCNPFDGTSLFIWLITIQDKAILQGWIPILTIDGKLLTTTFAEITLDQVRAQAQEIQNDGRRRAQNSEMLLCCLKNSITSRVYTKVYLQRDRYTIMKQPQNTTIEDGVCFLKVLIDAYHSNTRSSTTEVRRQLAHLGTYMKDVAKGDVSKLCSYARSLLYELNAAGETTHDLITNLICALQKAPDANFQRWFSNQIDLWSMKQRDWKEDGSDLMDEAELYYKEAKQTHRWGKKNTKETDDEPMYAFQAYGEDGQHKSRSISRHPKSKSEIAALTAQLKQYNKNIKWERNHAQSNKGIGSKYKWKLKPPKDGESTTKTVHTDCVTKKHHWCIYHKSWTIHSPKDCQEKPNRKHKHNKVAHRQSNQSSYTSAHDSSSTSSSPTEDESANSEEEDSNTS